MRVSRRKFIYAAVGIIGSMAISATPRALAGGYYAVDPPKPLGGLDLVAKQGRIDKATFTGRWSLLTIGYTSCPDVCPTILGNLAVVRAAMAEKLSAEALPQIVFVSVDPGRDSPGYLADYVDQFGKGFIGATGKRSAIDALVKSLSAVYRLGRKDKDGFYLVSHSAEIYLIGPEARLRARFVPPLDPQRTLADYRALTGIAPRAAAVTQ